MRAFCTRLRNKAAQVCLVYPNTAFHFCQVCRKLLTKEGAGLSSSKLGCALSSQCELLNDQDRTFEWTWLLLLVDVFKRALIGISLEF